MNTPRVDLQMLRVGHCRHLACIAARGDGWRWAEFPALCGLIRHPSRGWLLYDTGYAAHFDAATQAWPERAYATMLPVTLPAHDTLTAQLARLGLSPQQLAAVIVSHFHGDHVAGLKDCPNATLIGLRADRQQIEALRGPALHQRLRATLKGYLPAMLPDDLNTRWHDADTSPVLQLPRWMAPFETGLDLLGDGSVLGVPLPGHAAGQLGVLLPNTTVGPVLLSADACWSLAACREGRLPAAPVAWLSADHRRYLQTFADLGSLARRETELHILPSHCTTSWQAYQAQADAERGTQPGAQLGAGWAA